MARFNIPELKTVLPILEDCYGFDTTEISKELAESLKPYIDDRALDRIVLEQQSAGNNRLSILDYAINLDGDVEISTSIDFDKQQGDIINLCERYISDEDMQGTSKFVLRFMAAIFNRNTTKKDPEDIVIRYQENWNKLHPDLLRLFIALNKPRHKQDTPIKICFDTDSPHIITNRNGWFSDMLNGLIKQVLGDISLEKAEHELTTYSDDRGRKSSNPYLNYIINGTYNYITCFIKSDDDKVTVEQCRFLLEYLKIIGQVKNGDTIAKINTLQSSVRSLLNSTLTPVDKHIREHRLFSTR